MKKQKIGRPIKSTEPENPYRFLALKIIDQAFEDAKTLKGANCHVSKSGGGMIDKYELWNFFRSSLAETLLGNHSTITPEIMIKKAEDLLWKR